MLLYEKEKRITAQRAERHEDCVDGERVDGEGVTGLFLSYENTIGPAIDLLALVLREASRDRR